MRPKLNVTLHRWVAVGIQPTHHFHRRPVVTPTSQEPTIFLTAIVSRVGMDSKVGQLHFHGPLLPAQFLHFQVDAPLVRQNFQVFLNLIGPIDKLNVLRLGSVEWRITDLSYR